MIRVPHDPPAPRGWRARVLWGVGALIVLLSLATGGFAVWALAIPDPMPAAETALVSTPKVTVLKSPWYVFVPTTGSPRTGIIFYPGGRVDPRAYAPAAREIAQAGYLAVIVPMPLNLAVLAPGSARDVMQTYSEIQIWYVGGHSLGGVMAANYIYANPDCCAGLVLWAAYPAEENSLADHPTLRVLSVYGTRDGLATPDQIIESQARLPARARLLPIAGGNHAQFGWYGEQRGDHAATIDRAEQQRRAIDATLQLMASVD